MIEGIADLPTMIAVVLVLLSAGIVKGALGIGLPAVAMSLLPIFVEPAFAVTILSLPIVITNGQQFLTVRGWPKIVRRFLVAAAFLFVTIFGVSLFLAEAPSRFVAVVVGLSLSIFAVTGLMNIRLRVGMGFWWQAIIGVLAGMTGGLSAVKSPVMIYCASLELPKDEFIAAAGFLFFTGGVGMLIGLSSTSMLNAQTLPISVGALVVAVAGFQIGAVLRKRIDAKLFRKLLLGVMLLLGLRIVIVNLI